MHQALGPPPKQDDGVLANVFTEGAKTESVTPGLDVADAPLVEAGERGLA